MPSEQQHWGQGLIATWLFVLVFVLEEVLVQGFPGGFLVAGRLWVGFAIGSHSGEGLWTALGARPAMGALSQGSHGAAGEFALFLDLAVDRLFLCPLRFSGCMYV